MNARQPKPYQPDPAQIIDNINGYTTEVCLTEESKSVAYHLRYRAYINAFPHLENKGKILRDAFDDDENSRIHLIWYQNNAIATVRGCIWSRTYQWKKTEALTYFEKDIESQLKKFPLLESNRYAVDPDFQGRQSLFAQMLCFRVHALNSAFHECKYIITSVKSHHAPFYKRFLGLDVMSSMEVHIPWVNSDVVLLSAERTESLAVALQRGMPAFDDNDITNYAAKAQLGYSSLAA